MDYPALPSSVSAQNLKTTYNTTLGTGRELVPDSTTIPLSWTSMTGPVSYEVADNLYQLPLPTPPNLNLHDLEIFNHYAAYTSASLSDRDSVRLTWRVAVMKEAIPHDFLMHALLSFASAHLVQLCLAQREAYGQKAITHRNMALRSCIPYLRNITPTNCHALFAFSSIISVSTFAFPDITSTSSICPIENLLTFLVLIRGVQIVLQGGLDWIKSGSLNPLLQEGRVNWREQVASLPETFHAPFERLRALNENATADSGLRKVFAEAIQDLENSYGAHCLIAGDRSLVFIWCAIVPDAYVAEVRKKQPMALVILAHFAVLLNSVSAKWWAGDRGRRLAEAIHAKLDEQWKPAVQWPMDAVQVPSRPDPVITGSYCNYTVSSQGN